MDHFNKQSQAARFCDITVEYERILLPIEGYGKMPLVTLEQAVEPLILTVPDIRHMVWIVKQNCKNPHDHLSSDESASIMLYSMEWQPHENSFYIMLNKILCNENRSLLKPWLLYLKLIMTALSKIPAKHYFLYRGVKKNIIEDYPKGKAFVWWGFSSCTSSINVLEKETFMGKIGVRTLFTIDCYSGKDIRRHSMFKTEDEVLLLPARQFNVISSMNAGNDLNIIQIEEIESPYPLLEPLSMNSTSRQVKSLPSISPTKTSIHSSSHNENLEQIIRKCLSRKINLTGQQLNDQSMEIVIKQGLITNKCIILDMMYTEVTSNGVTMLTDALRNNMYLEELNISHNSVSDSGIQYLTTAINSSTLKRLDLADNDITDEGATYLAEMLTINTSLLELSLSDNRISSYGVKLLASALTHNNTHLESLNLSANIDISDEIIDSVVELMKYNQSVRKLDLRHNNLSMDGEKILWIAAKSKTGLKLWLSHYM